MANPFSFGGRITDPKQFVGRKAELNRIFSALESAESGQVQHVSVVGERRIGKSSLLYHVTRIYPQRLKEPKKYCFVYVDLDNPNCHNLVNLLGYILEELSLPVSKKLGLAEFQKAIEKFHASGICPVICLDEFEHLTMRPNEFPVSVYQTWRSLGNNGVAAFLTASHHPLTQLFQDGSLTSPFPNIFTVLELGNFSEEEADELIERGRTCDRPFTDDEIKKMRALGEGHPYKLQVAGQKIYLAKEGGTKVNWKKVHVDFNEQLKQAGLIPDGEPWYKMVWNGLLNFLRSIGRAVLEPRRNKTEISDSTALWWGVITLLVIILFLFGIIPLGLILKFGSHWLGK